MKKLSKIAALVLTMSLCLSFTAPAFAAETQAANDLQSRIYDAEHGITQVAYDAETMPNFDAYIEDENGVKTPVKTSYTVRKVVSLQTFSRSSVPAPEVYELTVVAREADKSYTDSASSDAFSVTGSLTMVFYPKDGWARPAPYLKEVSGQWVQDGVQNVSFTNRTVKWWNIGATTTKTNVSNPFSYTSIGLTGNPYIQVESSVTLVRSGTKTETMTITTNKVET